MTPTPTRRAAGTAAFAVLVLPLASLVVAQPVAKVFRVGLLGTVPLTNPEAARI
jgi:hypothetical protein